MKPLFVQIKCELTKTFQVAEYLVENVLETIEVYSISGAFDLLAKFHLEDDRSFGEFVTGTLHHVPGIKDTYSLVAFKLNWVPRPDTEKMEETRTHPATRSIS